MRFEAHMYNCPKEGFVLLSKDDDMQELVELARTLKQRGDIRADGQVEDDELVD